MDIPSSLSSAMKKFRESLDDKIYHVEHDIDMDGFASGIITTVALRRLGFEAYPYAVDRGKAFVPESGALVLTDVPLNNEPTETVDKAIERNMRVYVIDHHPWTPGYEKKPHAMINPHYISGIPKPSQWNAGFLAYLTFRDVVADFDWLAAISVYTDTCIAPWSRFLIDRYGYENVKKAGDMLTAFIAVTRDLSELDHILLNEITDLGNVFRDERFQKAYDEFNAAIQKYTENPRIYAVIWDERKKLMVIEVSERYLQINSIVSTIISLRPEFLDWVVVVLAKHPNEENLLKASLRCQKWEERIHMGELANKIAERIGGKGGGHPPAAGMRIPAEKKEEFLEVLQSLL